MCSSGHLSFNRSTMEYAVHAWLHRWSNVDESQDIQSPMSFVPGSRTSYSSGSTSSYRSITPTTPKPPPPPTAQPIKSALKQPSSSRGGRKDDPRFGPKLDPREELMMAIRSAGGRTALNKVRLRLQNFELSKACLHVLST